MKRKNIGAFAFVTLIALTITAGCHGQQPPSPTSYTCPAAPAGGTAYTEINAPASNTVPASITTTTTKDTPGTGTWCYIVQSWGLPAGATIYQTSVPSNIVQIATTMTDPVVDLSWTAPATNSTYASYTYILSRTAATAITTVPLAPPLNTPTTSVSMLANTIESNEAMQWNWAQPSSGVAVPLRLEAKLTK